VLDDAWMKRFCRADLATIVAMSDEKIKERFTVDEQPLNEYIQSTMMAVVRMCTRDHNNDVAEARRQREKRDLKRKAIDEYNKTVPKDQQKKYKVSESERFNGLKELPEQLEFPDEVKVIFIPFMLALICDATNGRFEHGIGCPCCGKDIVNPITGPLFDDYIKNNSHSAARRMKRTIPRFFLNGMFNCFPVCNTYIRPF